MEGKKFFELIVNEQNLIMSASFLDLPCNLIYKLNTKCWSNQYMIDN